MKHSYVGRWHNWFSMSKWAIANYNWFSEFYLFLFKSNHAAAFSLFTITLSEAFVGPTIVTTSLAAGLFLWVYFITVPAAGFSWFPPRCPPTMNLPWASITPTKKRKYIKYQNCTFCNATEAILHQVSKLLWPCFTTIPYPINPIYNQN